MTAQGKQIKKHELNLNQLRKMVRQTGADPQPNRYRPTWWPRCFEPLRDATFCHGGREVIKACRLLHALGDELDERLVARAEPLALLLDLVHDIHECGFLIAFEFPIAFEFLIIFCSYCRP